MIPKWSASAEGRERRDRLSNGGLRRHGVRGAPNAGGPRRSPTRTRQSRLGRGQDAFLPPDGDVKAIAVKRVEAGLCPAWKGAKPRPHRQTQALCGLAVGKAAELLSVFNCS